MPLRRSLLLLLGLISLASGPLVTAQELRIGPPSGPLETLRTEDLKRRASLLAAEGKRLEAARLAEQVAHRDPRMTAEWVRAIWLYYDAGAFPEMLRVARGYQAAFPGQANGQPEARAAEVLAGEKKLDWNVYRGRIRETPPGPTAQPVELASPEGQAALAYLLWRETGQPHRAGTVLEKLVRTHPDLPEARLLLVDLYRMLGREDDAFRERGEYIRLDPDSPRAAVFRVWRLKALGNKEEAVRELQAVRKKFPASLSLVKEIAEIYDALDRRDLVEATWRDSLLKNLKQNPEVFFGQLQSAIDTFAQQRQWDRLSGLMEGLLRERPGDPFISMTLAQAQALAGHPEKVVALARAGGQGPFAQELRVLGVYAALALGDTKTARELLPEKPRPELTPVAAWLAPDRRPTVEEYFTGQAPRFVVVPFHLSPQPTGARRVFLTYDAQWALEDRAAEKLPEAAPLQVQRALRLKDQGQVEQAAGIMEQVARQRPDWWPPLLFLYYYHAVGGRPEQAQQLQARLDRVKPAGIPVLGFPPPGIPAFPLAGASEERFPPQQRALRAAQALMLEGKLDEARAALLPLRDSPQVGPDVRRTLGALYLAQEKPEAAQREWAGVGGFHPPLTLQRFRYAAPFNVPALLTADLPHSKGDGSSLAHYPPAAVAVYAVEQFMRETLDPTLGERLWEFLLRQAVALDKEYVPALSGLAHILRVFPSPNSPRLPAEAQEKRKQEWQALLERVLQKDPANLAAYWALERYEEAARKNPESVAAWRWLTNGIRTKPELVLEARRNVRRLAPEDLENRYSLALLLAADHPEEALREARSLAELRLPSRAEELRKLPDQDLSARRPDPAVLGRTLAGALLFRQRDWAGARAEWAPLLGNAETWRAELGGVSLSALSALASLALGEVETTARELARAVRGNGSDPLPRLLLAWLARRDGKAAEAELQLAAAGPHEVRTPAEFNLNLEYEPVLEAILARYPDCFPATYLLAIHRSRRAGESFAGQTAAATARRTLELLAEQFPNWSGPVEVLQRGAWATEEGRGELLIRRRRELTVFLGPRITPPVGAGAAGGPGEFLRAARHEGDYFDELTVATAGDLVMLLGRKCQVFESRTGALVNVLDLPYHEVPAALAGRTVIKPVNGGAAALDAATGDLLWTLAWAPKLREAPRVQGETVILVAEDGSLLALEATSGKTLWQSGRPAVPLLNLAFEGERLFLVDRDGRTRALELKTGKELWIAPFPGAAQGGALRVERGQTLAFGGRLFLGSALEEGSTRTTVAFDTRTGKLLWTQGHSGSGLPAHWVQVGDQLAFVNTHYQEYELLDPATGKIVKSVPRDLRNARNSEWTGVFGSRMVWLDHRGQWQAMVPETGAVAWKQLRPDASRWKLALAPHAWLLVSGTHIEWRSR